jgi:long-chain acyl-CoA synthetase
VWWNKESACFTLASYPAILVRRDKLTPKLLFKELSRYKPGTYADIIYRNALLYPDREALIFGSERVTFAEFNARVNSLIHALQSMGVKRGDVIGVLAWNCLDYIYVFGAAMKGGFIISPFNCRLQAEELDYLINYSEANTLFVGPEFVKMAERLRPRIAKVRNFISFGGSTPNMTFHHDLLTNFSQEEPDVQVDEDDPLYIFYTSGTTGVPKGALYTHRCAVGDTRTRVTEMNLKAGDKNVMMMPLFHVGGADSMRVLFYVGGTSIIIREFEPVTVLQAIQDEKATDIQIVPTHLAAFLALPDVKKYDVSSLKRIYYTASPMPMELLKRGIEMWGFIFCQGYGLTETGPNVSTLHEEEHRVLYGSPEEQELLASAGQPNIGVQVRVVDQDNSDVAAGEAGEIVVRSKDMMVEWWHKPEETKQTVVDGWLHTGDIGRYDQKGYLYIVDRKKDMICSGGENIYPREVEEIIYQLPAVLEAAVIGIPDQYWVEKVHAVISLKKGSSLTAEEVINFCKGKIARYKAPKSVEFVESLPKNPSGKILKRELRQSYLGRQPEEG